MELIESVMKYLNAYEEDKETVEELIVTAEAYIDSTVGEGYKNNPKKVKLSELVIKKLVADMHENRSTVIESKLKQDRIVTTILDVLANEGD